MPMGSYSDSYDGRTGFQPVGSGLKRQELSSIVGVPAPEHKNQAVLGALAGAFRVDNEMTGTFISCKPAVTPPQTRSPSAAPSSRPAPPAAFRPVQASVARAQTAAHRVALVQAHAGRASFCQTSRTHPEVTQRRRKPPLREHQNSARHKQKMVVKKIRFCCQQSEVAPAILSPARFLPATRRPPRSRHSLRRRKRPARPLERRALQVPVPLRSRQVGCRLAANLIYDPVRRHRKFERHKRGYVRCPRPGRPDSLREPPTPAPPLRPADRTARFCWSPHRRCEQCCCRRQRTGSLRDRMRPTADQSSPAPRRASALSRSTRSGSSRMLLRPAAAPLDRRRTPDRERHDKARPCLLFRYAARRT